MKRIKFMDHPESFSEPTAFVAHIEHVKEKKELLQQLAELLQFPEYFGHNWDALDECINDLQWINDFKIILIHDYRIELDLKDLHIYLEILIYTINSWDRFNNPDFKSHEFEVIFPSQYENLIRPYEEKYLIKLEEFLQREHS